MSGIEISLLIVGIIFVIGSFFLSEKFTDKDTEELTKENKAKINAVMLKELEEVKSKISEIADKTVEQSIDSTMRNIEKETNDKIMTISEYSDGVLAEIRNTHEEVMFLYSMLNDKHEDLVNYANQLASIEKKIAQLNREVKDSYAEYSNVVNVKENSNNDNDEIRSNKENLDKVQLTKDIKEETEKLSISDSQNHNQQILDAYKSGQNPLDIARTLRLGIGEVKLVIDLSGKDVTNEA